MMRKIFFSIIIMLTGFYAMAQSNPVKWTFSSKKMTGNKYQLTMTATLLNGWHIYSQKTPDGGPEPTKFTFASNALVTNTGTPLEIGKIIRKKDDSFGVNVFYYSNKVDFVQTVTVKGAIKTNVSGDVYYMVCDDSRCLPPTTVKFNIPLK